MNRSKANKNNSTNDSPYKIFSSGKNLKLEIDTISNPKKGPHYLLHKNKNKKNYRPLTSHSTKDDKEYGSFTDANESEKQIIKDKVDEQIEKLSSIHCRNAIPVYETLFSLGLPKIGFATLYVPKGSRDAYLNTEPWSYFKTIVEE